MAKEQLGKSTPEVKQERETTLKEILADKEASSGFRELLKSSGNQDVAERLFEGELAEGDLQKLDEQRKEFNKRQQESLEETKKKKELLKDARETPRTGLTVEALTQFAGQSKQFDIVVKAVGAEGARNTILSQLEALVMRDPERLATILDVFKKFSESNKEKNKPDVDIAKICEKYGIKEDEFKDILSDNPDKESRQKALQEKIGEKMGKWKKFHNFSTEKRRGLQAEDILNKNEAIALKNGYENDLRAVGDAMEAAISKNDEVQKAFMSVLFGQEITQAPQKPKEEFLSFQEMRGMVPEEDALKKEYTTWAAAETQKNAGAPPDKDAFVGSYMGGKMGDKKSSWSDI